jgi:hypothetical protein
VTDRDPIAVWVARLNRLGQEMDEMVAGVHPSAWGEMTAKKRAEWHRLARQFPEDKERMADGTS